MPSDYLTVRANPQEFGGQVGQALQGAGQQLGKSSDEAQQYALLQQGMLNEHTASMGDLTFAEGMGKINDELRQYKGLEASQRVSLATSKVKELMDQMGSQMNPAARRAFETMASRRASYMIQDMNTYGTEQKWKAYGDGAQATINLAKDQASRFDVATNNSQFNLNTASIIDANNQWATAPGWGQFQGVPVKQGADGRLVFDQTTDAGKLAQAQYDFKVNNDIGEAYSNRIFAVAKDPVKGNYTNAEKLFEANRDKIPAKWADRIASELQGPYHQEQVRDITNGILSDYSNSYNSSGTVSSPNNLGNVKTASGGFASPETPQDGVLLAANNLRGDLYKGKTLGQIAETWAPKKDNNNPAQWAATVSKVSGLDVNSVPNLQDPAVVKSLVKGIATAEKSQQDASKFTPEMISAGVDDSFAGKKANLSQGSQTGNYQSYATYLGEHIGDIVQQARDKASAMGLDATQIDAAGREAESRVGQYLSQQRYEMYGYENTVMKAVLDPQHPVTSVAALDYAQDPALRDAWIKYQQGNYTGGLNIRRVIETNAQGRSRTYGTNFYNYLKDTLSQKVTDIDQFDPNAIGGDQYPLSNTGFVELNKVMGDMKTPEGLAFAHDELKFLDQVYGTMTGTKAYPGMNPGQLKDGFDKWLVQTLPIIQANRAKGATSAQMFSDPKSEYYLGNSFKAPSQGQLNTALEASMQAQANITSNPGATESRDWSKASQTDIKELYKTDPAKATEIAVKNGWIQDPRESQLNTELNTLPNAR